MKIINYTDINKNKWDNFVNSNSMGHTYHLYDFIKYDWYNEHKNVSFAICDDNDNILMISMLYIRLLKQNFLKKFFRKKRKAYLFSRWGFVIKDNLTQKQTNTIKKYYMEHIDSFFNQYTVKSYEVALAPFCDMMRPEQCPTINPLILWGFSPKQRYTYIIDLTSGEKNIFAGYESSLRNIINKIEKDNHLIIYESEGSESDFSYLKDIHIECYKQSKGHLLSVNYLKNIFSFCSQKKFCRLFFIKENNIVQAAIILMFFKDSIYYLWGFSRNNAPGYINKYFLHSLIKKYSIEGYHWFEVGGALPWLRSGKYKGLNDYKKSFSRKMHPIFSGLYVSK